jgi:YgiT-type zinc finger domain-containing protein
VTEQQPKETMSHARVTYTIELEGRVVVIENVPARVCAETGERFFAPDTVERIHQIIRGGQKPTRVVQTPVYEYAA